MMGHKATEDAFRESSRMYEDLVSNIPVGVYRFRMKAAGGWGFDFVSDRFCELTGLSREDILDNYETVFRLIYPDDLTEFISLNKSVAKALTHFRWEGRIIVNGETRWTLIESCPTQMDNGDVVYSGYFTDITDRKKAEEALEKRIVALTRPLDQANGIEFDELFNIEDIQRLQDQFAQAAGVASIITHTDGKPITRASNFCRLCGDIIRQTDKGLANCHMSDSVIGRYHPEGPVVRPCLSGGLWDAGASITVSGRHIANWLVGQVRNEAQSEEKIRDYAREIGVDEETAVKAFYEVPTMPQKQFEAVTQSLFTLANLLSNVAYHNVQQAKFIAERKRIEKELRQRKEELATILDAIPAMVWIGLDPECRVIKGNRLVNELFGAPSETNMSQTEAQKGQALFIKHLKTDGTEYRVDELPMQRAIATGQRIFDQEIEYQLPDGRQVFALGNAVPLFDDKGEVRGSVATFLDISERKKIEHLLRASEKLYRAVVDNLRFGIAVINRNMEIVTANDVLQQSCPRLRSQQAALCYQVYNDPPRSTVCEDCPCALTFQDGQPHKIDRQVVSQGLKRTYSIASYPVKDEHGEVELVIELSEDITESKLLQAQLFQSQKMEALGTLVGGIAHDFNNMLQVILGYSDLLLSDKRKSEPGYDELRTIIETAKGGADLVTKLLAFGQQAPIFPVNMDLNHQISQLSTLMSRTLPQVVQVDLDLAEGPSTIHADHGQIDQLVMNLAINAAEAMPNGGRLKIATKTASLDDEYCRGHHGLRPGSYVMLSVSDTGR